MTLIFPIAILVYSLVILAILFWIDLKTHLLPNKYVLQIFILGLVFISLTQFTVVAFIDSIAACLLGGGLLLMIREGGNRIYKTETLGMGDVKLIGAAGIWLGTEYIFLAIATGAFFGVIHGVVYASYLSKKKKKKVSFTHLSIPAGPGFIIGIILCALIKFHTLIPAIS